MASKLDRLQKKGFKVNEAALSKIARGDQEPGGEYSEININDIEETRIMPFTVSWIPRKILRCWPMISAARGCCTTWLCSLDRCWRKICAAFRRAPPACTALVGGAG